jgi:hypothetical protein
MFTPPQNNSIDEEAFAARREGRTRAESTYVRPQQKTSDIYRMSQSDIIEMLEKTYNVS